MKYCFIWKDSGAVVSRGIVFNSIEEAAKAKKRATGANLVAIAACYVCYEIGYTHKARRAPSVRLYRQYPNREIALRALWAMEEDPKTYGMPILREYVAGVLD